jgi:hypothetical protein
VKALQGWEKSGTQAHFENVTVLHLNSPEILQALRQSRGSRFLGNPLGPTAIIVNPGAWPQVMDVLAELGYLGDSSKIIDQE